MANTLMRPDEFEELRKYVTKNCDHKCHSVGLNSWIENCPICGCPNKDYIPNCLDKFDPPETTEKGE